VLGPGNPSAPDDGPGTRVSGPSVADRGIRVPAWLTG